jgi:hypothetical protein
MKKIIYILLILMTNNIYSVDNEIILTNNQYIFYNYRYIDSDIKFLFTEKERLPSYIYINETEETYESIYIFESIDFKKHSFSSFCMSYEYIEEQKLKSMIFSYFEEITELIKDTKIYIKYDTETLILDTYSSRVKIDDVYYDLRFYYDLTNTPIDILKNIVESSTLEISIDLLPLNMTETEIIKFKRFIQNFWIEDISKDDLIYLYEKSEELKFKNSEDE